jgi:endonuclease/exonuclease/phosphatase (EEP) superfamily protein YafD
VLTRLLVATVACGLLPLGARYWWVLEITSHFRLQYLAVAAALWLTASLLRKRILAAALLGVIVLNTWPLLPYLPRGSAAPSGTPLTVLNVNVQASNLEHERVLATLRASNADVVTLIELSQALDARLDALAETYPHSLRVPADGNFGLAVLSRHPLVDANRFELVTTAAISASVLAPGGEFRLLAAHLVPPVSAAMAAERNRQLDTLGTLARATDGTLLICGDFNLTPYSPYFTDFESTSGLSDTRRGQGFGISWPSTLPLLGVPIDHCFVRGRLTAAGIETMDQLGSDHYPVRVQLYWLD